MRKLLLLTLTMSLSANVLAAADGAGEDWPQFRGPRRDAVSREKNLLKEWPEKGPPLVWDSSVVNTGDNGSLGISWSTVSIANGKLYTVGSKDGNCFVFCLDEPTGKLVWSRKLGKGGRPNSTPTIDGDKLYTLTHEGDGADSFFESEGLLACLDAAKGDIVLDEGNPQGLQGTQRRLGFQRRAARRRQQARLYAGRRRGRPGGSQQAQRRRYLEVRHSRLRRLRPRFHRHRRSRRHPAIRNARGKQETRGGRCQCSQRQVPVELQRRGCGRGPRVH